jgi:signal peptidase
VLVALLLACNLYIIGARVIGGIDHPSIFGWSWAVVISGSMEDSISVNDMVVIHRQADYQPGDVITFRSADTIVTHRITEEHPDSYTTKGDANNAADLTPTMKSDVIGRVVLVIPGIGKFIEYLRTPLGMLCLVAIGFALIEIPYYIQTNRKR